MSTKMIKCNSCANDVASSAKTCPNCGAKIPKPIHKKWWFWLIIAIVFIFVISLFGGESDSSASSGDKKSETAISVSADELIRAYVNNTVTADEKYKDRYVTVTGTIYSIEEGYVVIEPDSEDLWLNNIYAYYDSGEKSKLADYSKGDRITMTGECKGEGFVSDVEIKYCVIE